MTMSEMPMAVVMTADSNCVMLRTSKAAGEVLLRGFTAVRDVGGLSFGLKSAPSTKATSRVRASDPPGS